MDEFKQKKKNQVEQIFVKTTYDEGEVAKKERVTNEKTISAMTFYGRSHSHTHTY